jgi:hypothetical protein
MLLDHLWTAEDHVAHGASIAHRDSLRAALAQVNAQTVH